MSSENSRGLRIFEFRKQLWTIIAQSCFRCELRRLFAPCWNNSVVSTTPQHQKLVEKHQPRTNKRVPLYAQRKNFERSNNALPAVYWTAKNEVIATITLRSYRKQFSLRAAASWCPTFAKCSFFGLGRLGLPKKNMNYWCFHFSAAPHLMTEWRYTIMAHKREASSSMACFSPIYFLMWHKLYPLDLSIWKSFLLGLESPGQGIWCRLLLKRQLKDFMKPSIINVNRVNSLGMAYKWQWPRHSSEETVL